MAYFPMFIDLNNKPVLIVGGGRVALRKLKKLAPYGAKPVVVAPNILEEITKLSGLTIYDRIFCEKDLDICPELVIAATDDGELNHQISKLCKEKHIPVNVADDPEQCTFLFPALVQQGNFSAGISTGGASPTAAVYFKERLQALIPENMDTILDWLEEKRQEMKKKIPDQAKRAGLFRQLFDLCLEKNRPLTDREYELFYQDSILGGKNTRGSVALVGAGCGKADLITVRGLRLLQQCEAVVYDDLIDPKLLGAVPETALRIYMGKRSGAHFAPQAEINQKLIDLAKEGLKVVRLKGGDPYLFGRGGEEMLALKAEGIPCQEVPGIPSAIGIPAEAGIPVTHRGASRGLHIITAHTSDTKDHLPEDFDYLAKLSGTLVFLMGLQQLPKIVSRLLTAGKNADTPAAVLSGGNSPNPARVRGCLSNIVQKVKEAGVVSPAIIMIGDVAGLDLLDKTKLLSGVRVGITGTEEIYKKQREALLELGAEPIWVARSMVKELPFIFPIEEMSAHKCWLTFTSANGVKIFFDWFDRNGYDRHLLQNYKFAVIGAATGKFLESYGVKVDLCPETYTSEGLANTLASEAKTDEDIILLRSAIGSPVLVQMLTGQGFAVRDISTYELETATDWDELPPLDYLTFSSASGVELFYKYNDCIPEKVKPVCIGIITGKALEKYTGEYLMAKEISVGGMVEAILESR